MTVAGAAPRSRIAAAALAPHAVLAGGLAAVERGDPALLTGTGALHRLLLLAGLVLWTDLALLPRLAGLERAALLRLVPEALAAGIAVLAGMLAGLAAGWLLLGVAGAGTNALAAINPAPQRWLQHSGGAGAALLLAAGAVGVATGGAVAALGMAGLTGRLRRGNTRPMAAGGALAALTLAPMALLPAIPWHPLLVLLAVVPALVVTRRARP